MSILPNLLRSLLLAAIFGFLCPVLLIGAMLVSLVVIGHVPGFEAIGGTGIEQMFNFLRVFGSGSVVGGIVVIGTVCSLVGVLFDIYTFYRYQNLRG